MLRLDGKHAFVTAAGDGIGRSIAIALAANLTPADVYFGRAEQILKQREEIKRKTMIKRRSRHQTENA